MAKQSGEKASVKDSTTIYILGLIISAFIAGSTAYFFLEQKIEKTVQTVFYDKKSKNELPAGPEGKQGPPGPTGSKGLNGVPVGTVIAYAGDVSNQLPAGWLVCDGKELPCGDPKFAALYAAIGVTHGGNPGVFFKLPDMLGRLAIGAGTGEGLTERRLGIRVGSETTTITVENLPPHNHPVDLKTEKDGAHTHVIDNGPGGDTGDGDGNVEVGSRSRHRNWPVWTISEGGAHQHHLKGSTQENVSANKPVSIMPPSVPLNILIKFE